MDISFPKRKRSNLLVEFTLSLSSILRNPPDGDPASEQRPSLLPVMNTPWITEFDWQSGTSSSFSTSFHLRSGQAISIEQTWRCPWIREQKNRAMLPYLSKLPKEATKTDWKSLWHLGGSAFGEGKDARNRRRRIGRWERLKIDFEEVSRWWERRGFEAGMAAVKREVIAVSVLMLAGWSERHSSSTQCKHLRLAFPREPLVSSSSPEVCREYRRIGKGSTTSL